MTDLGDAVAGWLTSARSKSANDNPAKGNEPTERKWRRVTPSQYRAEWPKSVSMAIDDFCSQKNSRWQLQAGRYYIILQEIDTQIKSKRMQIRSFNWIIRTRIRPTGTTVKSSDKAFPMRHQLECSPPPPSLQSTSRLNIYLTHKTFPCYDWKYKQASFVLFCCAHDTLLANVNHLADCSLH